MTELDLATLIVLPIGLGLLGFIEPCSLGSTLVLIKYLEGKSVGETIAQVVAFMAARAFFVGLMGMLAVLIGSAFLGLQKAGWLLLGLLYVVLGAFFLARREALLTVPIGAGLARLSQAQGAAGLGLVFGLNIPACAAPLLFALLGTAAASGVAGGTLAAGFISLALFGLALSLPLAASVLIPSARRALDWLAALSKRLPLWTGLLLVAIGLWSIWFSLFVEMAPQ